MLNVLFQAHSGLRYLVLLAALAAVVVLAWGLATRQPFGRPARVATAAFGGLLDLQIVLGLLMVALGLFYPSLMGHMTMMLLAAASAHGLSVLARKQADPRRAHSMALIGVVMALLFIVFGIHSIGRGVLESRARPAAEASR